MPNPKRQHSKRRSRLRRTHWKLRVASFSPCSHCGKPVIPHRVCPFCGFYKGKLIVEIKQKQEEKEAEPQEAKKEAKAKNA
ncbi:MAG TPA: 50S ribosomal protein L32 [Candidatus Omnitrophota bacterium]|nr:50S ribosomal protein L32 [Candidatus Omnitrophota bacterium]